MIEKSRECVNGVGDCDEDVLVSIDDLQFGESGAHVVIEKLVDCDGDDCEESLVHVLGEGAGHGTAHVELIHDDGDDPHEKRMVFVHAGGGQAYSFGSKTMLRCPEGDATIHVEREEADETFLCPKHSVPMESIVGSSMRRIRVKKGDD